MGTKRCLLKCRSVHRKPPGEQRSRRETVEVRGTKWNFDVELDSGVSGPHVTSRPDEWMLTATAPMEIPIVLPLAPPPEEYVPEIRGNSISGGGDVAAKTEMVILRPILHGSCENEGDWQGRPLHKHSWSTCSILAERGRQIDRYWPDHHCTEATGTQERHLRYDGIVEALCHFQGQVHHFREHSHGDSCNLPGIRVPKCTRWIHGETFCQVRGRSTAECKGSDDAFDGTEEFESARRDESI